MMDGADCNLILVIQPWNALLDYTTRDTKELMFCCYDETKNIISIYTEQSPEAIDADFARDSSRRSRTRYIILLNGGHIA